MKTEIQYQYNEATVRTILHHLAYIDVAHVMEALKLMNKTTGFKSQQRADAIEAYQRYVKG